MYTPSAPIGVNPYTVGTRPTAVIAAATAAKAQGIHEGAAIDNQLTTHRPTTVSDTGPANMVLLMIPALLGAVLLYRRKVQA